jgi:hypothetical protein
MKASPFMAGENQLFNKRYNNTIRFFIQGK